jgi:hypothetical protein
MRKNRGIKTVVLLAVLISFVASVGIALAGADKITLQGTVEQSDNGLIINAEDGTYMLSGEDLSNMVGKTVEVTGTVSESDAGKTINVMSVKEVE